MCVEDLPRYDRFCFLKKNFNFLKISYKVFVEISPKVCLETFIHEKSSDIYTVPIGCGGQQILAHLIHAKQ